MTYFIYLLSIAAIGFFIACGIFQFTLIGVKAPGKDTAKTIKSLVKKHKAINAGNTAGDSAILFISKFIRIGKYKRDTIESSLKIAGINKTPEVFYAGAVYKFLQPVVLIVPFIFFFQFMIPIIFTLAVLVCIRELQSPNTFIREKRKQIDLDLPRFVYSIVQELKNNHDVLTILERHKESFSPAFSGEIGITIADMRTGNYEAALQRFEGRIGSSNLSEVVRGLIEMVKGNDTNIYWETLAFKFSEIQKQNLRKEANKVPGKVKRLSFFLLLCLMFTYIVVLGTVVAENAAAFF